MYEFFLYVLLIYVHYDILELLLLEYDVTAMHCMDIYGNFMSVPVKGWVGVVHFMSGPHSKVPLTFITLLPTAFSIETNTVHCYRKTVEKVWPIRLDSQRIRGCYMYKYCTHCVVQYPETQKPVLRDDSYLCFCLSPSVLYGNGMALSNSTSSLYRPKGMQNFEQVTVGMILVFWWFELSKVAALHFYCRWQ